MFKPKHTTLSLALIASTGFMAPGSLAAETQTELWRMDCGRIEVNLLNAMSDSFAYPGQTKTLTNSCYLIRHGDDYMLWDAGLPAAMLNAPTDSSAPLSPTLERDLPSQLAEINVQPEQIGRVGISHYHFDHTGQAGLFKNATLLMGAEDLAALKQETPPVFADPASLAPWLADGGEVMPVSGDLDVFGDGSVMILSMPGHTPGETALLVNLADSGPVLLSGDVVHFREQVENEGVPPFNHDRAESLASMDRMADIAENLNATVIIQHDARDIDKLPAFPASAK